MSRLSVLKQTIATWLDPRRGDDTGAALVEYALLLVLIVMAAIVSMVYLGSTTHVPINNVAGHLSNAA